MASRQPYLADLNGTQWSILTSLIPVAKPDGRPEDIPSGNLLIRSWMSCGRVGHGVWYRTISLLGGSSIITLLLALASRGHPEAVGRPVRPCSDIEIARAFAEGYRAARIVAARWLTDIGLA